MGLGQSAKFAIYHSPGILIMKKYLLRKEKRMINCTYAPLKRDAVDKLYELCTEAEIEQENKRY